METAIKEEQFNAESTLHRVWSVELEIMNVIDRFCKDHNLRYSLFFGSLIGAIRHKGFIPWDDDIDIVMPRSDYESFAGLWLQDPPEGYLLVDKHGYHDYPNSFMKIVKQHTTFLQNEWDRHRTFPKGVFVDIFPADRYAPEGIRRKKQKFDCMISMLFTREYTSKAGGIIHAGEKVLLSLPKAIRAALRNKADKAIRKWNTRTDLPVLVPTTLASCRKLYPADMFDALEAVPFQGYEFFISSDYEGVLNACYKDYRTLPPEDKRVWTHHPILLDFEHDYEELQ